MVRDNAVKMSSQVGQEEARAAPTFYNRDLGAAKSVAGTVRVTTLRKLFSFPVFLGALLIAGVFLAISLRLQDVAGELPGHNHPSFVEGDTWWHVAVGEQIISTLTWPTTNHFSFTAPDSEWIAYEWLGEVTMALASRCAGFKGMLVLLLVLASAIVLLLYYYAYLRSGSVKAACAAAAILLPLVGTCFTLRPQLLGYIFILITLICLEQFRQGRWKSLWMLPGLFVLWVNTHGTFVLGLLALLVYWASGLIDLRSNGVWTERWTRAQRLHLEIIFLLSVLALAITPYGTRLIGYVLNMAFFQPVNLANIEEWQPLAFNQVFGKVFLGLVLLFLLAQVIWRFKYRVEELALLLFALYSACVHQRFLPFFGVIFAPILARMLAPWTPPYRPSKDRYALNAVLIVLFLTGIAGLFPSQNQLRQLIAGNYPVGAIEYLREHPVPGPMLNEHSWGGYLIRALGPGHKVFIDGREDAYEPAGVFADYLDITRLKPNTLSLLRKYGVRSCLIERDAPLATLLQSLPQWQKVYGDEVSSVLVRSPR